MTGSHRLTTGLQGGYVLSKGGGRVETGGSNTASTFVELCLTICQRMTVLLHRLRLLIRCTAAPCCASGYTLG